MNEFDAAPVVALVGTCVMAGFVLWASIEILTDIKTVLKRRDDDDGSTDAIRRKFSIFVGGLTDSEKRKKFSTRNFEDVYHDAIEWEMLYLMGYVNSVRDAIKMYGSGVDREVIETMSAFQKYYEVTDYDGCAIHFYGWDSNSTEQVEHHESHAIIRAHVVNTGEYDSLYYDPSFCWLADQAMYNIVINAVAQGEASANDLIIHEIIAASLSQLPNTGNLKM